ncbi:MAG: TatD family hydrolase [Bacteroidales bacterium]|nr:TatD family hydrolase [Bacteroidales bacterium]
MQEVNKIFINIHGHRQANNIQEWVMMNLMAKDYPPEDIESGYYSVGLHPYNVGKVDEEDTLMKVSLATENQNIFAIGEIGLDKSIEAPLDQQMRIFKSQVEIAEYAELPVILHVVRAFNEMVEFMKTHQPVVPMIIHGYNGSVQMAEELVKAGFLLSFGEAIANDHRKIIEALKSVPVEKLFLETDEGELDIREIYHLTAELKGISMDHLRVQIFENAKTHMARFAGLF